jgi:hypothetical protein
MLPVEQPFKTYTGIDGKPLTDGSVYFGIAGQDPITHPVTVYWDAAGTLPVFQPARTVNGYIVNDSGSAANVFYDGAYSTSVIDSKGRQVFYAQTSDSFSIGATVLGLSKPGGGTQIGCILSTTGARQRNVTDKAFETVSLDDFTGVDPTGATDSTAGVQAAFTWLSGGNRKLIGTPGASYKVSASIHLAGNSVCFDGRECIIINAINGPGGGAADPLIALTTTSGNFNKIKNFQVQYDTPANKGHTISIIGNGQNPQVTVIRNVRPNYQIGLGKDHNGASMAAYTVYAYGVYSVYCDEVYAQNGSGGLYFDTVQKVSARRCVIDSAANWGMYFDGCASVMVTDMNNLTGCGQDAQAAVYYNNCECFVFRGNRVKGGLGAEIMSGVTPSRSVTIADNHLEIYTANKNAIYAKTNTDSLTIENNYIKFIGGNGPFNAAVCIDDVGVATQARSAIAIRRNRVVVGGAETLGNGVLLTTATDQINGAIVESNTFGGPGVAAIITNAINFACTGTGNRATNNTIGSANVTVTNGVVLGAGATNTIAKDNPTGGAVTNPLVNNGTGTRRYLSQDIVPVLKGKTTAGTNAYSKQLGTVRMVEDVVHFTATVQLSSLDASLNGFAVIELDSTALGIPKAKNRANQFFSVSLSNEVFNTPAGCIGVKAYIQPGTTEVWFAFTQANAAAVSATQAHVTASFFVSVTGSYIAG